MVKEVLVWGNPLLRKISLPVEKGELQSEAFKSFLSDLVETMYVKDGVGLAAPQIGDLRRIIVLDVHQVVPGEKLRIMINPQIGSASGIQVGPEACLSVPGASVDEVERFNKIHCSYMDENGIDQVIEAEGFLAKAIQHELDHLNGTLYVDRISAAKRKEVKRQMDDYLK